MKFVTDNGERQVLRWYLELSYNQNHEYWERCHLIFGVCDVSITQDNYTDIDKLVCYMTGALQPASIIQLISNSQWLND